MGDVGIFSRLKSTAVGLFSRPNLVLPSDSPRLSDSEYAKAVKVCDWITRLIEIRDRYIEEHDLNRAINHPAANWSTDKEHFSGYRAVAGKDRHNINMLRVFTQAFSGHWMGLKLASGMTFPRKVPSDLTALIKHCIRELGAPESVWWIERRKRLIEIFPEFAGLSLPVAFGESGFRTDDGIILNHDLFVYLERIGLIKAVGVLNEINDGRRATVLEIGSGFGALAFLMRKVVPSSTYICLDIPESLCFSALYLSRFNANVHFADESTDWSSLAKYDLVFVPNYMFHRLVKSGLHVDLAINTLSMSEMTADQVRSYCEGIAKMIGKTGAFFEQNQDNRGIGLLFAKQIVGQIFSGAREASLPSMDLTQGAATLWRTSTRA